MCEDLKNRYSCLGAVRVLFPFGFDPVYTQYRSFIEMELLGDDVPATVQTTPSDVPLPSTKGKPRLETILERGTLRVGYFKDHLPFAFTNAHTKLVGLDIGFWVRFGVRFGVRHEY